MSLSPIKVADSVVEAFKKVLDTENERGLILEIDVGSETVVLRSVIAKNGTAEEDFAPIQQEVDGPCYILFSLQDEKTEGSWALVYYIPSSSSVKDKMLYSSTKENVKRGLGGSYFGVQDVFVYERKDLVFSAITESGTEEVAGDSLLSEAELAKKMALGLEVETSASNSGLVTSMSFPLDDEGKSAMEGFKTGSVCAFSLMMNVESEKLELVKSFNEGSAFEHAKEAMTGDVPLFVVFRVEAEELEKDGKKPIAFSYFCPESAPVKKKMVSSTAKSMVVDALSAFDISPNFKNEVQEAEELSMEEIVDELNPKDEEVKSYRKPSRPGRGGRRLMKK
mmetsp:Transcript_9316/g.25340  ORF Transcript_9316/g.25340 Transcript_9316/m.25340 type:complete len:337 (-) Transcript_9316:116-1126(-)